MPTAELTEDLTLIIQKLIQQGVQKNEIQNALLALLKTEVEENSYTLDTIPQIFIELAKQGISGGDIETPHKCKIQQIGNYCIISDYKNGHEIIFDNKGTPLYVSEKNRYSRTGSSTSNEYLLLERHGNVIFIREPNKGGGYKVISLSDGTNILDSALHPDEFFYPLESGHILSLPVRHNYESKKLDVKIYDVEGKIIIEGKADFPKGYHIWGFDGGNIIKLKKNDTNKEEGERIINISIL